MVGIVCTPNHFIFKLEEEMNLAVIDGSLLAFRAAAAGEKRTIRVTHLSSGRKQKFQNRREFTNYLKGINENRAEDKQFYATDFEVEDVIVSPEIGNSIHILKNLIKTILSGCDADDYVIFLDDGEPTFRHDLATMQEYKGSRHGKIKPKNVQKVKDYLVMYMGAKVVSTVEADDYLNFYQWRGFKRTKDGKNDKIISVTFDKDAFGCPGWIYDFRKHANGKPYMREPMFIEGLGELHVDENNSVKGTGRKFFYHQVLFGDNADDYRGNKLANKPFGEKASFNILENLETDQECLQAIVDQYKEWYGEKKFKYISWRGDKLSATWFTFLEEIWMLAYMRRTEDDVPDVLSILKSLDVEV